MPERVSWSPPAFMAKYKNFKVNLNKDEYFPISAGLRTYGRAEFEVDKKKKKTKKNAEKKLSYHTLKDLLYNQNFTQFWEKK